MLCFPNLFAVNFYDAFHSVILFRCRYRQMMLEMRHLCFEFSHDCWAVVPSLFCYREQTNSPSLCSYSIRISLTSGPSRQ